MRCIVLPILGLGLISLLFYGAFVAFNPGEANELFLATTTSVENTGLLDFLIDKFEDQGSYKVKYSAVGSGAAIQLGRDGEVDAVLVHAPLLEQELKDDGYVTSSTTLWFNYFTIIGPPSDPAGVDDASSAAQAMQLIRSAGEAGEATFYSRGDQSGTHIKELSLWEAANITLDPTAEWYFETGTGMSSTIVTAEEDPDAYVLTDLGTYAVLLEADTHLEKVPLLDQDPVLYNPYSYLIIDETIFDGINLNTVAAEAFLEFLEEPSTVEMVRDYTVGGKVLFTPIEA